MKYKFSSRPARCCTQPKCGFSSSNNFLCFGGLLQYVPAICALHSTRMPGSIDRIEVENFKSYRNVHTIPFTQFTSVIGPNGSGIFSSPCYILPLYISALHYKHHVCQSFSPFSGKSNLMDAISFVLGMKTQRLRSSNLRELVYKGPSETKPAPGIPYVSIPLPSITDLSLSFSYLRTQLI